MFVVFYLLIVFVVFGVKFTAHLKVQSLTMVRDKIFHSFVIS